MTIKTQDGKIVTKDGKVSCECCETYCCMYPAQALADGEYSANDLPDAVTVDGTSFSRSGTSYGNTTNGVILEENVWAKYRNAARSTRACLIQGGVKDQFADTYTVTSNIANETVTRVSLCRWSWESDTIPQTAGALCAIYVEYFPSSLSWEITTILTLEDDSTDPPIYYCTDTWVGLKNQFQNSPAGQYNDFFESVVS